MLVTSILSFSHNVFLPGGSVVSMSDSRAGGCEFDTHLGQNFFPGYFRLSPLLKHVRKVVDGFGKKSCVNTGVRKLGASPKAMIWTLAVKVVLNPDTTNNSQLAFMNRDTDESLNLYEWRQIDS